MDADFQAKEFEALRNEILERIKLLSQTEYAKLVTVGLVLAFAFSREFDNPRTMAIPILLILPFLAVLFDLHVGWNLAYIHRIGAYIRDDIETKSSTTEGWEHYLLKHKTFRWDLLERSLHLGVTLSVGLLGIFTAIGLPVWSLVVYIILFTIAVVIDIVVIGVPGTIRSRYS